MQTFEPANPLPIKPLTCPSCAKPMRLVSAVPATIYPNLKQAKFRCDCGWISDVLVPDKD